jgi:hypothetical protein
MFAVSDMSWAPWYVAHTDDKRRARLNIITHLLSQVPYEPPPKQAVTLPKRKVHATEPSDGVSLRFIPTPF